MSTATEDVILTMDCSEPSGLIARSVRLCELSMAKLRFLHEKLSKFEVLFNDFTKDNPEAFIRAFVNIDQYGDVHPNGLVWEVDDVGILALTDIVPQNTAKAHFTFWDRRIRGREGLIRAMLKYVFEQLGLHRIVVEIPLYAVAAMAAVERMGFRKEGRMREAVLYRGEWFDVNLYSILDREV